MDKKWLNFAGLQHTCIYNRENPTCPYNQFRKMDQVEKLEKLLTIKNADAILMQKTCSSMRSQCNPVIPFSLKNLSEANKPMNETALSA